MTSEVLHLWDRALRSIQTAASLTDYDPDAAASRAYYAAFYAVSALFLHRGRAFTKHKAVEKAVHRDLVKAGAWMKELGATFSWLGSLRATGDYGGEARVTVKQAHNAVQAAQSVIDATRATLGGPLPEAPSSP